MRLTAIIPGVALLFSPLAVCAGAPAGAALTHGPAPAVAPVLATGEASGAAQLWRASTSDAGSPGMSGADAPVEVLTAPGLRLPATFLGTLPMASGPGADWHLDLWPDQVFHLRQDFADEAAPAADIGRWSADPARGAIVLHGGREAPVFLQVTGNADLRLMTSEGAPIESELPYTLAAGALDPAEVSLPMSGHFRYMADAALFEECLTGRSYPVATEGAYLDTERAYLGLEGRAPGEAVFVLLDGTLAVRPAMEGPDRTHLVIDRFTRFEPGQACPRPAGAAEAEAPVPLTDTYWRILEAGGTDMTAAEDAREAHLVLREGESAGWNGTAGCNIMRGGYTLEGEALSFGPAAMTMMACPPPLDAMEQALSRALGQTAGWQIDGTRLTLTDGSGAALVVAEAAYRP